MKNLLLLVSLALSSTTTFSQTVTKIANDTSVVMNKRLVEFMIQDLKQSDADKVLFTYSIQSRDSIIESYHSRMLSYESKFDDLNKRLVTYRTLSEQQSVELDGKDSRIQELTKQLRIVKRQRNWSMVAGVLGIAGVHLSWKYVNWKTRYGSKN